MGTLYLCVSSVCTLCYTYLVISSLCHHVHQLHWWNCKLSLFSLCKQSDGKVNKWKKWKSEKSNKWLFSILLLFYVSNIKNVYKYQHCSYKVFSYIIRYEFWNPSTISSYTFCFCCRSISYYFISKPKWKSLILWLKVAKLKLSKGCVYIIK